jgi:antitoxin ParD1/3/4
MRANKPISVTLGKLQAKVDERVRSGEYSSASEVLRAGLRALDREQVLLDEIWRRKIQQAYDDPRPSIPAAEVFAELRARYGDTPDES